MGVAALLVEDDENKLDHVLSFTSEEFPLLKVDVARSFQGALKMLLTKAYRLVILDMTLPTFDKVATEPAGSLRALGGKDLLDQIHRRRIDTRAIVLTGYDILGEGTHATPLKRVEADLRLTYQRLFVAAVFLFSVGRQVEI